MSKLLSLYKQMPPKYFIFSYYDIDDMLCRGLVLVSDDVPLVRLASGQYLLHIHRPDGVQLCPAEGR